MRYLPEVNDEALTTVALVRVFDNVGIAGEEHAVSVGVNWNQFKVLDAVDLLLSGCIIRIETWSAPAFLQQQTQLVFMQRTDLKFWNETLISICSLDRIFLRHRRIRFTSNAIVFDGDGNGNVMMTLQRFFFPGREVLLEKCRFATINNAIHLHRYNTIRPRFSFIEKNNIGKRCGPASRSGSSFRSDIYWPCSWPMLFLLWCTGVRSRQIFQILPYPECNNPAMTNPPPFKSELNQMNCC